MPRKAAPATYPSLARGKGNDANAPATTYNWPMGELSTHDPFSLTGLTYDDVLLLPEQIGRASCKERVLLLV